MNSFLYESLFAKFNNVRSTSVDDTPAPANSVKNSSAYQQKSSAIPQQLTSASVLSDVSFIKSYQTPFTKFDSLFQSK